MNNNNKQIIKNFISFYTTIGSPIPIGYVNLVVTYSCNARCIMCNVWKLYRENPKEKKELENDMFYKTISNFKILQKVDNILIGITGGEPFLKKNIAKLIIELANLSFVHTIIVSTNGFLTEKIISDTKKILQKIPPNKNFLINVSIDGIGDKHDLIRGTKGLFEKACKTLNLLLKIKKNNTNLQVSIATTLQPANIHQFDEIEKFGSKKNVPITYSVVQRSYALNNMNFKGNIQNFTQRQFKKLESIAEQKKLFGVSKWINNKYKRPLKCFAGFTALAIDPFGDVYPCLTTCNNKNFVMGNIIHDSLDNIWSSSKAWDIRKKIKMCRHTDCWCGCEINQSVVQYSLYNQIIKKLTIGKVDYFSLKGLR